MDFIEVLKIVFIGIIEGITEWLPVSSTGHMMIFNHFFPLGLSDAFVEVFEYVIQLGAILAVIVLFINKLWPIKRKTVDGENGAEPIRKIYADRGVLRTWLKVVIACIPAVVAVVADKIFDTIENKTAMIVIVASMLIIYGIAFIVVETVNAKRQPKITTVDDIDYKTAFFIGCFQILAAVPGTSRSGITIIGALIIGVARPAAAEFTFFLAVPTMVGASGYKIVKYLVNGNAFGMPEISAMLLGMAVAFAVSLATIKFLMNFVKKHDFKPFGIYRIILGIAVVGLCIFL